MGTLASNNNINSLPQAPHEGTEAVECGSYSDFNNVSGNIFKLRPNFCKQNGGWCKSMARKLEIVVKTVLARDWWWCCVGRPAGLDLMAVMSFDWPRPVPGGAQLAAARHCPAHPAVRPHHRHQEAWQSGAGPWQHRSGSSQLFNPQAAWKSLKLEAAAASSNGSRVCPGQPMRCGAGWWRRGRVVRGWSRAGGHLSPQL